MTKDGTEREQYSTLLIWKLNFEQISVPELEELVDKCSSKNRWISDNDLVDYRRERLHHGSEEIENVAENILKKMIKAIERKEVIIDSTSAENEEEIKNKHHKITLLPRVA